MSKEDLLVRLHVSIVASCTCLTKTPDISFHAIDCRYRLLVEAIAEITRLRADKARLEGYIRDAGFKEWISD